MTGFVLGWWHFFRGNQSFTFLPEKLALALCLGLLLYSLVRIELRGSIRVPLVLVFLGEASYSIYLVHANCMRWGEAALLRLVPSLPQHAGEVQAFLVADVLVAVACGVAYYWFIERLLLRRGRQWLNETVRS